MYENIELDSLIVQVTRGCNLNCRHCFNSGSREGKMEVEQLKQVIEKSLKYNIMEISLSGGEPLSHPEIHEILSVIKQYPQISFGILTNGTLLTEKMMQEIEESENIFMQISFDGSKKEIYEAIRGAGTFERFWHGLELLAGSKIKDKRVRTAVSRVNYKDVGNICRIACEKRVSPSFLFVARLGNACESWDDLCLTDVQKVHVNNIINNFNKQYGAKVGTIYPAGGCGFGCREERKTFTVDVNGDVFTCDYFYDFPIGNIYCENWMSILRGKSLLKIYQTVEERNKKMEQNEECKQCSIKDECKYGCPGETKYMKGAIQDSSCLFRKLYYGCIVAELI